MTIKNLELQKAEDFFNKEVKINPKNPGANFNLARVYKEKGDYKKAKFFYEKVIKIQPKNYSAYNNLANIYKLMGEFSKAIKLYKKVISINPEHSRAHHNLGNTYNQLGQFNKAIKAFKKTFQLHPSNLESLYILSNLDKKILSSKLKEKIKYTMANQKILKKDIAYGNFLLAKYEYKNKNFKRELNYLIEAHQNYYQSKKIFFDGMVNYWLNYLPNAKQFLELNTIEADSKIKPIFIIGVPRCGSTVVERVIASGKKTIPIGEECGVISGTAGELILSNESLKLNTSHLKNLINEKYKNLNLLKKESDNIFTDKTLENFFFIPLIKKIYPKAKIINCMRDPSSSIISVIKNNLTEVPWAHHIDNIFNYFDIYYKKIDYYKKKYPGFIYDLNFEKFQNNPEAESKKLKKFCNLVWDRKCLEFYKRPNLVSYTSSHMQIRKPIYKASLDRHLPYRNLLYKYANKYVWFK